MNYNRSRSARCALFLLLFCCIASGVASEVTFSSNDVFSDRELRMQMSLPEEFNQLSSNRQQYFIEVGRYRIKQFYDNKGYFSSQTECFLINREESDYWICEVVEGERWTFGEIRYSSSNLPLLQQKPEAKIKPGDPFRNKNLTEEIERFGEAFRNLGYIHLRTDYTLVPDTLNHCMDLEIRLTPGEQVKMGAFKIHSNRIATSTNPEGGAGLTNEEYLEKLWAIPPGDNVVGKEFNAYRKKLLQTGLFRQVQLKDSLLENKLSDIHLLTVEKQPGNWTNRLFWDPLFLGPGVESQVRYRNFLGSFHEGSIGALMSENRQRIALGYAHPLPFGTIFRFDDKLSYNQEELPIINYPDSLEKRYEFRNRSTISRLFTPNIRALFSADIRRITLYAGEQSSPDSLERSAYNKFNLEPVLDLQYTDDWLEPTKGWRARLTLLNGGRFNRRFNSIDLKTGFYFPIGSRIHWAVAGDAGIFFDAGDGDDARAFYQGGFRSVRGYRERSIFPSKTTMVENEEGVEEEMIQPGLSPRYLRLSNEFRINMPRAIKSMQLVQFTDWAHVADQDGSFTPGEEMGVGVGVRYRFPFLTLRIDYTLKRNFRDFLEPEGFGWNRFSFDLSQAI